MAAAPGGNGGAGSAASDGVAPLVASSDSTSSSGISS